MATEPTHRVVGLDPLWPEPAQLTAQPGPPRRRIDLAKLATTNRKITLAKAKALVAKAPAADPSTNGRHPKCNRCGGHHDQSYDCFGVSYQAWAERGYQW